MFCAKRDLTLSHYWKAKLELNQLRLVSRSPSLSFRLSNSTTLAAQYTHICKHMGGLAMMMMVMMVMLVSARLKL